MPIKRILVFILILVGLNLLFFYIFTPFIKNNFDQSLGLLITVFTIMNVICTVILVLIMGVLLLVMPDNFDYKVPYVIVFFLSLLAYFLFTGGALIQDGFFHTLKLLTMAALFNSIFIYISSKCTDILLL